MKVTLRTGREVNIPEHITDMTLKQFIDFDIQHQRINEVIRTSEELDDLDMSARIFVIMVEGLAELTGSKVEDWLEEETGDLVSTLIRIQKEEQSMFDAQELVLTKCWALVFDAIRSYKEKELDLQQDLEFEYWEYKKGKRGDKQITWVIPGFVASIYGGSKPPKMKVWQVTEANEANRAYKEAMKIYGQKFKEDELVNKQGSALYEKILREVASLARPKTGKLYQPKTQTGLRDEIEQRVVHFVDIGAKAALDVAFFLGGSIRQSVNRVIINSTFNHQSLSLPQVEQNT